MNDGTGIFSEAGKNYLSVYSILYSASSFYSNSSFPFSFTVPVLADLNGDGLTDFVVGLTDSTYLYADNQVFLQAGPRTTYTFSGTGISVQFGTDHQVVATFSGDSSTPPSSSAPMDLVATKVPTTLTLVADPQTGSSQGQTVDIIASVSPTTEEEGTINNSGVYFYDMDRFPPGIGVGFFVNGYAELNVNSLPQGTNRLYAVFPDNSQFLGSTSNTFTVTVGPPATTTTQVIAWVPSTLNLLSGATLGTGVLDATDSIPATISYTKSVPPGPAIPVYPTSVMTQGAYLLTATFTPTDPTTYAQTTDTIPFSVQNMNVFVGNSTGSVTSFYNNGTLQTPTAPGGGIGAAVDPTGHVWSISADGTSLAYYTNDGIQVNIFSNLNLTGATNVAIDGSGNLWITNGANSVSVYSATERCFTPRPPRHSTSRRPAVSTSRGTSG